MFVPYFLPRPHDVRGVELIREKETYDLAHCDAATKYCCLLLVARKHATRPTPNANSVTVSQNWVTIVLQYCSSTSDVCLGRDAFVVGCRLL